MGADIGDVCYPGGIGLCYIELLLKEVGCRDCCRPTTGTGADLLLIHYRSLDAKVCKIDHPLDGTVMIYVKAVALANLALQHILR